MKIFGSGGEEGYDGELIGVSKYGILAGERINGLGSR